MPHRTTSLAEENYLKAVFKLTEKHGKDTRITTNSIAEIMQTSAASVTDMMRKLGDKGLLSYAKYKGVQLSEEGVAIAKNLIRKHRLWEVFLMQKLGFSWHEVHDMAEDLEHISHPGLIDRLESFLEYPRFDPHGDPIPDKDGNIHYHEDIHLSQLKESEEGIVVAVVKDSADFLRYLDKVGLVLQAKVKVTEVESFDNSRKVVLNGEKELVLTDKVSKNLLIRRVR
ncbi:MAG: DtxR family Mn-dependent transcriptional regulator [Limisphaerales bacterium]|jgi:DtxR family Mn-dependent transcriptional regulator